MKTGTRFLSGERGAALMLSLWALFLLSALVISWALDISARITLSGGANRVLEAEAMACSGAEIALHPAIAPNSPALHGGIGRGQTYQVRITGEGGRLNLNWLVAGENPAKIEVLRKFLEIKGIDLNERDHMLDCLLDWVDPDNLVRLNGAEADGDYHPRNGPLQLLDEVKRIRGWDDFTANDDWDSDFTLNGTVGQIDIAWASRDVLLALPGMTEQLVDRFLEMRRGPDGIDGTEDDAPFKSAREALAAFGFSPDQIKELEPLVGFKEAVLRVVSVGTSGGVTRTVRMVVRKTGGNVQLISWKEI